MTWLDIVDSSSKIGLGAAIGGGIALLMNRANQTHEFRKERWRRLQDSLENICETFEGIHSVFLLRCVRTGPDVVFPKETEHLATEKESYESLLKRSGDAFLKLHQLEGRLLLLGLIAAAEQLTAYRLRAADIEAVSVHGENIAAELHPIATDLGALRARLYETLSENYTRARKP